MPHVRRPLRRRDFVGVSIAPSSSSEDPEASCSSDSAFATAFALGFRFRRGLERREATVGEATLAVLATLGLAALAALLYELRTPTILLLLPAPPLDDGKVGKSCTRGGRTSKRLFLCFIGC